MKKLIALALSLVMLLGLVPTSLAVNSPTVTTANSSLTELAGDDGVLKILSIGNSYSRDCMHYLKRILHAEGVENVKLGYMYIDGCTLAGHWSNIQKESTAYRYYTNNNDSWQFYSTANSMKAGITAEDWDVITLQEGVYRAGQPDSFTNGTLDNLLDYIHANKTNPKCKVGWNMSKSLMEGFVSGSSDEFKTLYGSDPTVMYKAVVSMVKSYIEPRSDIDFIIPTGTAIQNIRSSFIGETVYFGGPLNGHASDGVHLSDMGRLLAAYTWYAALSNTPLTEMKFTNCFPHKLTSAEHKAIVEAIGNALKTPYDQTKSTYAAEPAQYTVTVDGLSSKWMPGDTVPITAVAAETRKFTGWEVVSGGVKLADANSVDTTFTMPDSNVEVKATYASTDSGYAPVTGLEAGFCRVDVTPEESIPLGGYGNATSRMSTGTLSEDDGLWITANVLSDAGTTTIIYTADFIRIPEGWADKIRPDISAATGVPVENIAFSSTHTHSGPDLGTTVTETHPYFEVWKQGHIDAAVGAMADLAPVSEVKIASIQVPNKNYVRHWRAKNAFMVGVNFTTGANGAANGGSNGTPEKADDTLRIIRFVRPGDEKKDVVFLNWQGHPTTASTSQSNSDCGMRGRYKLSADYVKYMRDAIEARDGDCNVSFFLSASGNVNMNIVSNREAFIHEPIHEPNLLGEHLADYAMKAMKDLKSVEIGPIECLYQDHVAIYEDYTTTYDVEQTVITIGKSIAIGTAPYEMFNISAMDVREASPYEMTFLITCGGYVGYVAAWETFVYPVFGGATAYEATLSARRIAQGSAEDLADGLIGMMNKLYRD